jgi:hypothetical protein
MLRQITYEAAAHASEPDVTREEVEAVVSKKIVSQLGEYNYQLDLVAGNRTVSSAITLEPKALNPVLALVSPTLEVSAHAIAFSY